MVKQNINIVGILPLYNILNEIKENLSFNVFNSIKLNDYLKDLNKKKFLTITEFDNKNFFLKNNFDKKNILFLSKKKIFINNTEEFNILRYPVELNFLIEKINIFLIKNKYNHQSKIRINNYYLDLNSRIISQDNTNLKLTEKEMNIILFLNDNKKPQKINILQSKVWGYASDLETHTVETHVYRLRKKINNNFKDDNFIVSSDDGYLIK